MFAIFFFFLLLNECCTYQDGEIVSKIKIYLIFKINVSKRLCHVSCLFMFSNLIKNIQTKNYLDTNEIALTIIFI